MDNELYRLGEEVGAALKAGNLVLTTAESCTGGWIGEVVTMISGSSAWYDRGFITYTNAAKQQMLGVKAATLREHGAVSEPVVREMAPGFKAHLWGYNGQSPGPTIEVVEGDRVRIFVTNKLGEMTTVHWHGQRLPNGMDGVTGLTQPGIPPGKTFV